MHLDSQNMGQHLHRWKASSMTRFTIKRCSGEHDGTSGERCLVGEETQEDAEQDLNRSLLQRRCFQANEEDEVVSTSKGTQERVYVTGSSLKPSNAFHKSAPFGSSTKIHPSPSSVGPAIRRHFSFIPFKSSPKEPTNQNHLLPLAQMTSDPPTASSGVATVSPFSYSPVAQRGRTFAARHTRRLVFKDGTCNVTSANVTQRKKKYLVDIFTTCVDMRWRYLLALFAGAFLCSWIVFGIAWYAIAVSRGDHLFHLREDPSPPETTQVHSNNSNNGTSSNSSSFSSSSSSQTLSTPYGDMRPCVNNVFDFPTAFLFSIETQHTIGYGFRVVEPTCSPGIFLLMVQSCIGIFVQSLMTGLIFAKLSQPKKRAHTIMFSKCAVITKRDGVYCLLFRVGDMRRSHFVATSIRALLVKDRVTKEGECIPLCQCPLDVKTETSAGDAFVFMVWPVVVVHRIDISSPLWNLSASQLLQEKFEIIVIMEGIVESTGMTTQVRTSYLPGEILWGHCLAPLLTYQKENGQYKIDYAQFHSIVGMADMPECSAMEYSTMKVETELDEAQFHISPYFTIPPKVTTNTNRVSVIQRVRGSLKLRRSKKDKIPVPCTAPVLSSADTNVSDSNVFFAGLETLNSASKTNVGSAVEHSISPQLSSKPSIEFSGEDLFVQDTHNVSTTQTPSATSDPDCDVRERTFFPQPGISSTELRSSSSGSSSNESDANKSATPVEGNHVPRFTCNINVPVVNVAFT